PFVVDVYSLDKPMEAHGVTFIPLALLGLIFVASLLRQGPRQFVARVFPLANSHDHSKCIQGHSTAESSCCHESKPAGESSCCKESKPAGGSRCHCHSDDKK
ncbi:MAG: hypothetical protein V1754_11100, partial [Pseudomonadota bacterium]